MNFPASDVFSESGCSLDAETWLWSILEALRALRQLLPDDAFMQEWNERLAYKGETRRIRNYKGETGCFAF
jgi:hypothetical protein